MASSSPKKKDKFQLSNVPAVLEWQDADDQYRHLGHTLPLTLDAKLDVANATASLKLRVALALKGAAKRVPFYLFIPPDRIASVIVADDTEPLQPPVTATLLNTRKRPASTSPSPSSSSILRLRFLLAAPPALVGPPDLPTASSPPVPQTGPSARALDALRALVGRHRASSSSSLSLHLHIPRQSVPDGFVEALCANAGPGRLFAVPRERGSLYSGRGGKEVEWPEEGEEDDGGGGGGGERGWGGRRGDEAEAESPPSYDELGVLPEPGARMSSSSSVPREKQWGEKQSGERGRAVMAGRKRGKSARSSPSDCEDRRPRKKTGGFTQAAADSKTALEVAGYDWSRGVDERVASLNEQLEALKKAIGGGGTAAAAVTGTTEVAPTPSTVADDDTSDVAAAADPTSDDVCTRLARLESEMAAVRTDVAAANTRWEELAEELREQGKKVLEDMRWSIMEDMEELLGRSRDEVVDEAECRMEDRFSSAKEELREAVEEECENAEERIKELLSSGAAGVYFEFPKS